MPLFKDYICILENVSFENETRPRSGIVGSVLLFVASYYDFRDMLFFFSVKDRLHYLALNQ